MNVVLLTTATPHHTYYAWQLNKHFPLKAIVLETEGLSPPFETAHPFEIDRDAYEKEVLLAGFGGAIDDITEVRSVRSANEPAAISALQQIAPDIILVFGTRKLKMPIVETAKVACLNLHGGNPEFYRGLDTHLWAIYHGEFEQLVTTIHYVDSRLDNGNIIFEDQLNIQASTELYQLRAINTKICVNLSLLALESLNYRGLLPNRKQVRQGRYYSFMPAVLKEECLKKFRRYVRKL